MLYFRVDGIPQSKGSWRPAGRRRSGGIRLVPDNEAETAWAEQVAWAARQALRRPPTPDRQRYQVTLDFTLLPPPSGRRTNRRDLDKLCRSVLDALTGIVWVDDEQVDRIMLDKGIAFERGRTQPGVDVEIEVHDGTRYWTVL